MLDLTGQTVIVTGANGNLGAAVAQLLAAQGARLVLAGSRPQELEALAARIAGSGHRRVAADLRTPDGAQRVAADAIAAFGRIHAVVNTVGLFKMADLADAASDDWQLIMELNALTALRLCEAVLPDMRRHRYGRIVNVGSAAGLRASAGAAVYAASKAAVQRITEAASEENKALGVTANCILPGTIDTPQNRAAMPDADHSLWVSPEQVAAVAAFLVSPAAAGVTGASIPVTGRQ